MPFNALLLPLLGGYIFVQNWNQTRFSNSRHSGQRLLFHAAIAGSVLMAVAYALALLTHRLAPSWVSSWQQMVPFQYAGASTVAFLIGTVAWWPLNRWLHPRNKAVERVIERWNDHLEMLLQRALRETHQVSITTKSRKFYVGFITRNFNPAYKRKSIRLLPTLSGYRKPESLRVEITTDYAAVYADLIKERPEFLTSHAENYEMVIAVDEIVTAKIFDPEAYELFQNAGDQDGEAGAQKTRIT